MNVIVTAVGAVIGYGIVRSLRRSKFPVTVIGTDIYPEAAGQIWCDKFVRVPLTASPEYRDAMAKIIQQEKAALVFPGIPADVAWFSANRQWLRDLTGVAVLNTPELIELGSDKWKTHRFLTRHGLPAAKTLLPSSFEEAADALGLPFLVKPRGRCGSQGIARIAAKESFLSAQMALGSDMLAQEIVGSDQEEYTVGVFGLGDGLTGGWLSMRRILNRDGSTVKAWVVADRQLDEQVDCLARLSSPVGPTNFQFRRHEGRFLLLDVNPRFSSSTSMRALFGFNEAEMSVDWFAFKRRPARPEIRRGCAVRYYEDVVWYDGDHQ